MATQTPAVPELPFESVPEPIALPPDIHIGEIAAAVSRRAGPDANERFYGIAYRTAQIFDTRLQRVGT